jgi:hypothetical protein
MRLLECQRMLSRVTREYEVKSRSLKKEIGVLNRLMAEENTKNPYAPPGKIPEDESYDDEEVGRIMENDDVALGSM